MRKYKMSHINKIVNSQIKTKQKIKFVLENSTKNKKVILTKKYCHGTKRIEKIAQTNVN